MENGRTVNVYVKLESPDGDGNAVCKVYADGGMLEEIKGVEGVLYCSVLYETQYTVGIDPRYDTDYVLMTLANVAQEETERREKIMMGDVEE